MLDLAEEVWETFPACYTAQENEFILPLWRFRGSQRAPELPLDLTLPNIECSKIDSLVVSALHAASFQCCVCALAGLIESIVPRPFLPETTVRVLDSHILFGRNYVLS